MPEEQEELLPNPKNKSRVGYFPLGLGLFLGAMFIMLLTYTTMRALSSPSLESIRQDQAKTLTELNDLKKEVVRLRLTQDKNDTTTEEVRRMREEIALIKKMPSASTDILGLADIALGRTADSYLTPSPSPTPTPTKLFVTLKDRWETVDIHAGKNASSKIIGQAKQGKNYEYTKKEGSYYYITLSATLKGWVHEQFVTEAN